MTGAATSIDAARVELLLNELRLVVGSTIAPRIRISRFDDENGP